MKRDMELIRKIMLEAETADGPSSDFAIAGYDDDVVRHHVWLLGGAGLLDVFEITTRAKLPQAIPHCITWGGHEFLDDARNETVWNAARKRVGELAGSVSFAVFSQALTEITLQKLGIKPQSMITND